MIVQAAILVLLPLVCSLPQQAGEDEYYDPIVKLKRERESLLEARSKVRAKISKADDEMAKDSKGFYKANEADCVKTKVFADGSFEYRYPPRDEWTAQWDQLSTKIDLHERELLKAYQEAIERLTTLEAHLLNRWQSWGDAVSRLKAVGKDLKAGEEEWRKTMVMAGWDCVNELVPAVSEGMNGWGERLTQPVKGSIWARIPPAKRANLRRAIEKFQLASENLSRSAKVLLAGVDLAKEKDAKKAGDEIFEISKNVTEIFEDILQEHSIGSTVAEQEEFKQARAAVWGFVDIVRAGATFAEGGKLDLEMKTRLSDAAVSVVKFAAKFNPVFRAASAIYGTGAKALETGIAGRAWWANWTAERKNEDNLGYARRMTAAANEDLDAVSARLESYKAEKAAIEKKRERKR